MADKTASLMSIPAELRLQVYEILALQELDYVVCLPTGKYSWLYPDKDGQSAPQTLRLDWMSLGLTCKTIRAEIADIHSANSKHSRTYILQLLAARKILKRTAWRSLPCPPDSVDTSFVDCVLSTKFGLKYWRSFMGCGGFDPVISDLYRTLNRLIRFGPRVASTTPLPEPMRIKKVMMQVRPEVTDDNIGPQTHAKLEKVAHHLAHFACRLADDGMAFGFVDEIEFQVDGQKLAAVSLARMWLS